MLNISSKLKNGNINNLTDVEKQHLNDILQINKPPIINDTNELHEKHNFWIVIGLIIFSGLSIILFHSNNTIITIASTAIGGVIGYLVPNIKKTS